MIVKDEEQTIGRVLGDCQKVCDELVVVDTGSSDETVEIAESFGARVVHHEWADDFAAARNAAFDACLGDWILWLDADDRLPGVVQDRLQFVWRDRLTMLDADAIYLPYHYSYVPDTDQLQLSFQRERIIRRRAALRWQYPVHEAIDVPPGRGIVAEDLWVEHRPIAERRARNRDRNIRILERAYADGDRSLRVLFYYANELRDHERFEEALAIYDEYFATAPIGWERYHAHLRNAHCLYQLGRLDEAASEYVEAIQEDSSRAEAYVRLGVVHYEASRWSHALPLFLAATGCTQPDFGFVEPGDYRHTPWDFLSVCYWRLGQNEKALEALGKAARGNPDVDRLSENARWILGDLRRA